jgi:surfeit locus 1 family protein
LTLVALPAFGILIGLGLWQLDRLAWKTALIEERQMALARPAIEAPADDTALAKLDYQRVSLAGRFDHAHELHLAAISVKGDGGYRVLTPLIRDDGGSAVLVNRGWVPYAQKDPRTRGESLADGPIVLEGVAVRPRPKAMFDADNDPVRNDWYWIDLDAMAEATGRALSPVIVNALPGLGVREGFPRAEPTEVRLVNNHFQYALTWFALAAGLAVIYLLLLRQGRSMRT